MLLAYAVGAYTTIAYDLGTGGAYYVAGIAVLLARFALRPILRNRSSERGPTLAELNSGATIDRAPEEDPPVPRFLSGGLIVLALGLGYLAATSMTV